MDSHLWERLELATTPPDALPLEHLIHVLACGECREWLLGYLLDQQTNEETQEALYAAAWEKLDRNYPEVERAARQRRREAEGLLGELVSASPDQRGPLLREERFRSLDLLDLLLEMSHDRQISDPVQALSLAEAASRLAVDLSDAEPEAGIAVSRAFCLEANVLRLQNELKRAEAGLAKASPFVDTAIARAFYCRTAALVRCEQGRSAEAVALLEHALRLFQAEGPQEEAEVCLALLGLLMFEENQVPQALPRLHRAWKRLDRERCPHVALKVGLSLAVSLALAQQPGKARQVRNEAWKLYSMISMPEDMVRIYGLEGRLLAVLGEYEEAEGVLDSVRLKLLEESSLGEATLAALDLGMVLAARGKAEKLAALAGSLEKAVEAAPLGIAVVALMSLAEESLRGDFPPWEWHSASRVALLRAIRAVGLRFRPLQFA
jgi:tetratricopeptide (TPR) repeat protein